MLHFDNPLVYFLSRRQYALQASCDVQLTPNKVERAADSVSYYPHGRNLDDESPGSVIPGESLECLMKTDR